MIASVVAALVLAISLCADCFAVSVCSSVTLEKTDVRSVVQIGFVFGLVHSGLFFIGYCFGNSFVGYLERIADWIGFLLLMYVGGSMILDVIRGKNEVHDLGGIRKVLLAAVATSIDALAVGISLSMDGDSFDDMLVKALAIFFVTVPSVIAGMFCGSRIGKRLGNIAQVIGGIVLILIGFNVLMDFI